MLELRPQILLLAALIEFELAVGYPLDESFERVVPKLAGYPGSLLHDLQSRGLTLKQLHWASVEYSAPALGALAALCEVYAESRISTARRLVDKVALLVDR
jgi:hypothetical protein